MKIGEKIKQLRTKRAVTQETLANHLGISFQAVSKWENGTALPDITLVPALSNYFGVSADELLGLQDAANSAELAEYENQFWQLWHYIDKKGWLLSEENKQEAIDFCRKVLEKYPRNTRWMYLLACCLVPIFGDGKENCSKAEFEEAISLYEHILEDCPDNILRNTAKRHVCEYYIKVGKREKAIEFAENTPQEISRAQMFEIAYDGTEIGTKVLQESLQEEFESCAHTLWKLSRAPYTNYSWHDKLHCIEARIKLSDILFQGEENAFLWNSNYMDAYLEIACMYAGDQGMEYFDAQKTMEYLFKAEKAAQRYDKWRYGDMRFYKSIFMNKCEFGYKEGLIKGERGYMVEKLYDKIKDEPCFDSMKDIPEFAELMARLASP